MKLCAIEKIFLVPGGRFCFAIRLGALVNFYFFKCHTHHHPPVAFSSHTHLRWRSRRRCAGQKTKRQPRQQRKRHSPQRVQRKEGLPNRKRSRSHEFERSSIASLAATRGSSGHFLSALAFCATHMSKVELKLKLELLSISGRSAFPFGIFFHFGKQFGNLKFKIWEIRISVWERAFYCTSFF